ncbi:exopolysaccharide transport family protein [Nostoc sp. TCL26-01]|uniref:GumC family protein n=1 Tax=Nostoc sp. TCL26-01 TaxID=2576904 RepID=UPI0015BFAB8F|nr:exopolysaccharide transport family protein [Nostoc sp. TCL26-01]QLE54242.1 chain-length determining protein [Nostoc sp. TCL26-01]
MTNSLPNTVKFRHISKILMRRRFIVIGVSCVVMSVTSVMAIMTKPNYKSYMQILVSANVAEEVGGKNSQLTNDYYATQKNLMLSSKLIDAAVKLLRPDYPQINVGEIKEKIAVLELPQLADEPVINSSINPILNISFQDNDPVKTQKVLLALQQVYQNYNLEERKERFNQGLAFINTRLPVIKNQVKQAEKKLEQFRKKHNVLDPELQSKILVKSLADIQQQLQITRAQLQDVQTRYQNLEQKIADSSRKAAFSLRLNQSSRYQTLLSELQKTEQALTQEQLRYTDDSPVVQTLKQERQSQLKLLQQELKRLTAESTQEIEEAQKQFVGVDPNLVEELIQLQTTALGLVANEKSLAESEQRTRLELSKYPTLIAEYQRLLPEVETQRKTLEQMLQAQQSVGLKIAQGGFDWQVLEEPTLGTYSSNDRLWLVIAGMVTGPILGVVMALIWGMRHRIIHSAQELQKVANLRLLGAVPKLAPRAMEKRLPSLSWLGESKLPPAVIEAESWLPCHETLDMVYQNTQILKYPFSFKSVMITSALPGEGRTTLALGLAASAAHMHRRVLLIDANLRSPKLHKTLQLSNDWGLSLLLLDETNSQFQDYIQPIHPAIDILTAGPTPEDAVKLLSSQHLKELIESFEETYDLVLIDAPPILGTVDARILASYCNGIMMVGRIGWVTQTELTQAVEILNRLNLVGIIANEVGR